MKSPTTAAPRKPRAKRMTRKFFSTIGTLGGRATSDTKAITSAANGKLGGRPRKIVEGVQS